MGGGCRWIIVVDWLVGWDLGVDDWLAWGFYLFRYVVAEVGALGSPFFFHVVEGIVGAASLSLLWFILMQSIYG